MHSYTAWCPWSFSLQDRCHLASGRDPDDTPTACSRHINHSPRIHSQASQEGRLVRWQVQFAIIHNHGINQGGESPIHGDFQDSLFVGGIERTIWAKSRTFDTTK